MKKIRQAPFLAVLSLAVVGWGSLEARGYSETDAFPVAKIHVDSQDFVWWEPSIDFDRMTLSVSGPGEVSFRAEFESGATPFFEILDLEGFPLPEGGYSYELHVTPRVDPELEAILDKARSEGREAEAAKLVAERRSSWGPIFQSGTFSVLDATFVVPGVSPEVPGGTEESDSDEPADDEEGDTGGGDGQRGTVINEDLIVIGSECVGVDCANGENFGFDTIRLKENNLRIKFDDTSASASFPSNDWQITANESENGGLDKFSIDDVTGGRTPFTIEAGAPSHSLYVDDGGRVGLGTSTPVVELHVVDGDTPTLRLEQNGSSGFMPQTWDVAGNEAGFFVRDVTNGSLLSFRIRPGAPESSIDIASNGDVGIGASAPTASLHVRRSDGTAQFLVEEVSATVTGRNLMELSNSGGAGIRYRNNNSGNTWSSGTSSSNTFIMNTGAVSTLEFSMDSGGNLTIAGTLMQGSDENSKENFEEVDTEKILEEIVALPIRTWTYKADPDSAKHLGPTAQDFHRAFGLGPDDRHIAPGDVSAASLGAIQELAKRLDDQRAKTERLEQEKQDLITRLERVEALLTRKIAGDD